MDLGLLLQVFLISVLLLSSSIGAPFKPNLQNRPEDASVNLNDDDDDIDVTDDDDSELNSLPKVVLGEVPLHPLQLPGFLTNQNLLVKQSVPWVKEPINPQSGVWVKNGEKASVLPLNSAIPLSNPAIPGSPSPLLNAVSTNNIQAPPVAYYPNRKVYYGWSGPGFGSDGNSGSTVKRGTPHLVYEQVFDYPAVNADSPHSTYGSSSIVSANYGQIGEGSGTGNPAAKHPQTIFSQVPGSPYPLKIYQDGNLTLGQNGYVPLDKRITWPWQGRVINTQDAVVMQRLGQPVFPVSNYFVQSRNGYRNHRLFASRASYTPLASGIFEGVNSPMLS